PQSLVSSPPTAMSTTSTRTLHDALPIYVGDAECPRDVPVQLLERHAEQRCQQEETGDARVCGRARDGDRGRAHTRLSSSSASSSDRKSTRLNSSHGSTPSAVFCLKKKNQ